MQEQDRSEEATPHKRREARKQGTVAWSPDVYAAAAVGTLLAILVMGGASLHADLAALWREMWLPGRAEASGPQQLAAWSAAVAWRAVLVLAPLWIALLLVSLAAGMLQVGMKWTAAPLKPDFSRLSPANGFKRLFNRRVLFEAGKSVVRFLVFSAVLYHALSTLLPGWLPLPVMAAGRAGKEAGAGLILVLQRLFLAMLVFAIVDWGWVRRSVMSKLRMSKRELREEIKRRDGDPRIKSRLREIRLLFMNKIRSVSRVKDADVLLVNPQHLALAIRYKKDEMAVPLLLAKGEGELAERMKEIAHHHQVPIMENRVLAQKLYKDAEAGQNIPEQHFEDVAKALIWAFRIKAGNVPVPGMRQRWTS